MKKLVALVLFVCVMMAFSAFAEANNDRIVLQNEQAPELITFEDENGQTVVAKVCDAEGNVLSYVKDDGTIVFTDVHARTEVEDEVIVQRLTSAYEWVMYGVHYSDVEAIAHEDVLKIDINTALINAGYDLTAHDLVMFELFDTMLYGDELPEGYYVEFTLSLEEEQSLPLLIAFTPDGAEWEVFHDYTVDGSNVTFRIEKSGTIAMMLDHETAVTLGDSYEQDVIIEGDATEGEIELNNFTPSVTGKPAPSIISFADEEGNIHVGKIMNKNHTQVINIPNKSYLIVTPLSERDYVSDIQTHEHLEWAYDSIQGVESVGNLPTEEEDVALGVEIDLLLNDREEGLTHHYMIVRDLFEVTVYGEYVDFFYEEGAFVELTFDANIDPEEPFIVLCSHNSVNWHSLPAEDVIVNANGTVTLRLEDLGTIAFLVDVEGTLVNVNIEDAVISPN